jgi:hypothetical protein
LTLEIATKDRPEEKSLLPMSIVAFSRVIPWLLWIATAHARVRGNCVLDSDFPVLSSAKSYHSGCHVSMDIFLLLPFFDLLSWYFLHPGSSLFPASRLVVELLQSCPIYSSDVCSHFRFAVSFSLCHSILLTVPQACSISLTLAVSLWRR